MYKKNAECHAACKIVEKVARNLLTIFIHIAIKGSDAMASEKASSSILTPIPATPKTPRAVEKTPSVQKLTE